MTNKYRYSILTFIIGKNYEKVHEIENKQYDVEYVLITDNDSIKSTTWKIIVDDNLNILKSPFEKCFNIRYNPFKYCSTDICITIDGSMKIVSSLDLIVNEFNEKSYDIALMPHFERINIINEYLIWCKYRNYKIELANNALKFLVSINYDFSINGLFQSGFMIRRNNFVTNKLNKLVLSILYYLSDDNNFDRVDLTILTAVVNKFFSNLNILPISESVIKDKPIQIYEHNSTKRNIGCFVKKDEDYKYVLNNKVKCYLIK